MQLHGIFVLSYYSSKTFSCCNFYEILNLDRVLFLVFKKRRPPHIYTTHNNLEICFLLLFLLVLCGWIWVHISGRPDLKEPLGAEKTVWHYKKEKAADACLGLCSGIITKPFRTRKRWKVQQLWKNSSDIFSLKSMELQKMTRRWFFCVYLMILFI